MTTVKTPEERMASNQRWKRVWRWLTYITVVLAVLFPDSPYLMAWVIFMSGHALEVGYKAAYEGAAPSAKED